MLWVDIAVSLRNDGICVMVRVRSPYHHKTWPFSAYDDGMKIHDDHLLIWVAGVCRMLNLSSSTFRGTPHTDFSFGVYSRSLIPAMGNPQGSGAEHFWSDP